MITHIYFDFFGTLVDYDPSIHPEVNAPLAFARRAGCRISAETASARWQAAWDRLEADAEASGREFSMTDVAQQYWEFIGSPPVRRGEMTTLVTEYLEAWTAKISPAQHAAECLSYLAADHALAIVSNTHDPDLVPGLARRFGLHTSVERIITSIDVGWRKPHPGIFAAALRESGAQPGDALFVGDNWEADVVGPREAGMSALYVGRPGNGRRSVPLAALPAVVRALT